MEVILDCPRVTEDHLNANYMDEVIWFYFLFFFNIVSYYYYYYNLHSGI